MGKNLTSIPGTSGPSHPLQSTIQPILGVLEQFWPKNLAEQANPTASLECKPSSKHLDVEIISGMPAVTLGPFLQTSFAGSKV